MNYLEALVKLIGDISGIAIEAASGTKTKQELVASYAEAVAKTTAVLSTMRESLAADDDTIDIKIKDKFPT